MPISTCLSDGISEKERPLLNLKFQGKESYLCPQCMPTVIHKPHQLAYKLTGFRPTDAHLTDDH